MVAFYNLPRISKVIAISLSITLGVTIPLLAEHIFTIKIIANSSYLIITPLTILSGITPFLKAKNKEIDFYFWKTSRHGLKIFMERELWRSLAMKAFMDLGRNVQEVTGPRFGGIAEEVSD